MMSEETEERIGFWSAISIGIGGMVGGGIFAVMGLAAHLAQGATPVAFLVAGIVALLTCYSYAKLSVRFPSEGGTVDFLNRAFGVGVLTGSLNVLLCMAYVVMLSLYAYAFGSYGASFFSEDPFWRHALTSGVIIVLTIVNFVGASVVLKAENAINVTKMVILVLFVIVGLSAGVNWERLEISQWVEPLQIVSGGMIIFLNYEGFELIANAAKQVDDPKRTLPRAYFGGVAMVMVLYALIAIVAVGHLDVKHLESAHDYALAVSAGSFMGHAGFILIAVAALLATASAINATLFGSARMTFILAREGELPQLFEKEVWHKPLQGLLIIAVVTLVVSNLFDLHAIATMGSAGFLIIFCAVNLANVRLADQTASRAWISGLGALACLAALGVMCWQVYANAKTRSQLWILVAMVGLAFLFEFVYRRLSGRVHKGLGEDQA